MNYLPSSLKTVTLSLCIPNQSAKNISPLFSETTDQPNFVCKPLCIRKGDAGHMTKMAVMLIYGKALENIPSGNGGPISTKRGMKHLKLKPIIFCSSDNPGLILINTTQNLLSIKI